MKELISKKILINFISKEIDSDRDFFADQLKHFNLHLNELRTTAGDPLKMGFSAHKNRSGCQIFGALKLELILRQVEILAKTQNLKELNEQFQLAVLLIEPTLSEMKKISEEYFESLQKSG